MTSRRERRSVSLGRHRERGPRDTSRGPHPADEGHVEVSTRHNISNYLLTLQRLQASEDENQILRRENDLLRQRARSSRLSSASFRGDSSHNNNTTIGSNSTTSSTGSGNASGGCSSAIIHRNKNQNSSAILRDTEDAKIEADVKRNSLLFVGDELPASFVEHEALEAQYKKLQEDFDTVKEFLKHLFQHALTTSSSSGNLSEQTLQLKGNKETKDINSCNLSPSKQFERSLDDIHGQISKLKNSQDQQQVKMEQVQQALDNVLCQSSVRNDVTMRIVRQSDKMKELSRQSSFLERQLAAASIAVRQAEEKSRLANHIASHVDTFLAANGRSFKGNTKDELAKISGRIARLGKTNSTCHCKLEAINNLVDYVTTLNSGGKGFTESRPPAEVVDAMSKLERLIGSDWHRLGRVLGLPPETLEEVGKFTNFDLTSRVEKVVTSWTRLNPHRASSDVLRQALESMDRDALLLGEQPLCKDWQQLPPEISAYLITHVIDVPSLVTELCGHGVISADNRNFILGLAQEQRRASRLLQSVTYMGVEALKLCCSALEQLNQGQIANRVRDYLSDRQDSNQPFLTLDLNNRPATRTRKSASQNKSNRNSTITSASSSSYYSPVQQTSAFSPSTPSSVTAHRLSNSASSSAVSSNSSSVTNNSTPPIPASSSSKGSKSNEKQHRKKRSRSLFTRKNKLRDTEPDPYDIDDPEADINAGFTPIAPQAYYNYYHPGINTNVVSCRETSAWERGRGGREWGERGSRDERNVARRNDGGSMGNYSSSSSGGTDSLPWVRNPHHQQQGSRPNSKFVNINSGADEVAV